MNAPVTTAAPATPAKTKRVFKCTIPNSKFIFSNGKAANFVAGKYLTDLESEISALEFEIKSGHPHIYIDSGESEVDAAGLDPLAEIKAKAIAEYLAQQQKATDPNNDMGKTEQGKLQGVGNSTSVAPLAINSAAGVASAVNSIKAATPSAAAVLTPPPATK